ncbi:MAG: MlaA family lipoprotein [Francisellaceae bacterium]
MKKQTILLLISASALLLSGCATQQNRDPYEGFNRAIFTFNEKANDYVLIPAAKGYNYVMPSDFQHGIDNAYNNLLEPGRVVNDLLQMNFGYALKDSARFLANTIFGVFGLFDAARYMGLPRHRQDFGFTLAYWGYRYSPYLVLPILGPSTVGNTIGGIPDGLMNPINYSAVAPAYISWSAYGGYKFNQGALYLPQYQKLVGSAIDPYVAVRNAYLQNLDYETNKNLGITTSPQNDGSVNQQEVLNLLDD